RQGMRRTLRACAAPRFPAAAAHTRASMRSAGCQSWGRPVAVIMTLTARTLPALRSRSYIARVPYFPIAALRVRAVVYSMICQRPRVGFHAITQAVNRVSAILSPLVSGALGAGSQYLL